MSQRFMLSLLTICLLNLPVSAHAEANTPPTSLPGRFSAGCLQIVHRHPYYLSLGTALYLSQNKLSINAENLSEIFGKSTALLGIWIGGGAVLKTTARVIMDNFNIKPIEE